MSELRSNLKKLHTTAILSRELDRFEEGLYPAEVKYQFSAMGHEVSQLALADCLDSPKDAVASYYRCRPLLLGLGASLEQALLASLSKANSYSGGRDSGVVANFAPENAPRLLPVAGDVGSQYTPAVGWAEAISYYTNQLKVPEYQRAIAVAHGGDGSVASNGFWAALNIACTRTLPMLFFIEDNGYAISVPADHQTPGGNIAKNLGSYQNLRIIEADASQIVATVQLIAEAVEHVRQQRSPCLLRVVVSRLCGHSAQDTQSYKSKEQREREKTADSLRALEHELGISSQESEELRNDARQQVTRAYAKAKAAPEPQVANLRTHLFSATQEEEGSSSPVNSIEQGGRINMVEAIRLTLASEMRTNAKLLLLGEDIGQKGGVHTATMGLREEFGAARVIDTSLSEEGIIGSSVGLALSGLRPVAEIQFRKYADAGTEQLVNCGTLRWRTNGACSAPLVVRMPVGVGRDRADPWHSVSGEAVWLHQIGWRVAMPSTVRDAVGLLRTALREEDPTFFFEHRALLDAAYARGRYPGDDYELAFGRARILQQGSNATVVSWGYMLERCQAAIDALSADVTLIDLRTLRPWDEETVFESLRSTNRLLIVHEDQISLGFGAEIAARVADQLFECLDAPIKRLAVPDTPIPYNSALCEATIPSRTAIAETLQALLSY